MQNLQIKHKKNLLTSHFICWSSYGFALLGVFVLTFYLKDKLNQIVIALIADIVATIIIFSLSSLLKNTSLYDPYWSVAPIFIAIYWISANNGFKSLTIKQGVIFGLVCLWGIRLTFNWIRSWKGLKDEDWRYTKYRVESPKVFWLINLFGLQLMPTLLVFLGCLPLYSVFSATSTKFAVFDIIGIIITLVAIILETIADEQLRRFKKKKKQGELMIYGLWSYSRHPNYLGEISFWWGIWFFALSIDVVANWWMVVGAISITFLFIIISIPLIEGRMSKRYPNYEEYKKRVAMLIPLPRKKE